MKQLGFMFVAVMCMCSLSLQAEEIEHSLTNTLDELQVELQATRVQRAEAQKFYRADYERQHQQMIDVITSSNELAIMLYTQEQRRTFDMAFALKQVTSSYNDFNQSRRPYDQVISGLNFEIDRYARLIEALRRLPPQMKEIEVEIVPDSLLYRNDSLDQHLEETSSTLEKEIITIAIKDSASAPFVLDVTGEQYRDSCILYASELLKLYADRRDSIMSDSTHYMEAYLRTKEAYDYAEARYGELDKYVFSDGQVPYMTVLKKFSLYWKLMRRSLRNQYGFREFKRARENDELFCNAVIGRAEKAFAVLSSATQLIALLIVWTLIYLIFRLVYRFTKVRNLVSVRSLPLFAVLVGTVLYFILSGYFWDGSAYVQSGMRTFKTYLWLMMAISGSLLLRVDSEQIRHGVRLYVPGFILSMLVILFRNTFMPDIVLNVVLPPLLLVVVIGQLIVCLRESGKSPRVDAILGWVSLSVYVLTLLVSFCGYIFAALVVLVLWYFMLAALLTILCIRDLMEEYKERNKKNKVVKELHKLVKQVGIPVMILVSLPICTRMSLDIVDLTDLYTKYYKEPFFQIADQATEASTFSISLISIINLMILFFMLRYLNEVLHTVWKQARYGAYMRKHNCTHVPANEINLSLGNSLITVAIWMIYAVVVVNVWDIPTGSLGLIAGGLSAGIGIALKDIINNFIYGIQLMGGRVRVGDWIECDGVRGKVTAINYQCVQVETLQGTEMSFLNASLFGKNFNNLTRNNSYEFTKILVGVAYGTDIPHVREVLVKAMQKLRTQDKYGREIVEPDRGIYVAVDNMSESSVDIAVKQFVLVAERGGYIDRAKEVIYTALNEEGISIPFPQCDVHLIGNE